MQSVQQQVLEKQIEQLFIQLVSIWKESDTKKIEAVKMLASKMEELYLQLGWQINTISADITRKLEAAGITKTAHHVSDYLDPKYKREKAPAYNLNEGNPAIGIIDGNNLLDLMRRINGNIQQITKDEAQSFHEAYLKLKSAAETNKQYCEINGWALSDDDPLKKKWPEVHTEMPEPKDTDASDVWKFEVLSVVEKFYNAHKETANKLVKLPPEAEQVKAMVPAFKEYSELLKNLLGPISEFMAPFKDLKFATSKPKWWQSVIKFFDHGKHAAAVMDAIDSHKYLEDRLIDVMKVQCPSNGCPYFATISEGITEPMDPFARSQIKLLTEHIMDTHDKKTRYLPLKAERGKVIVQVPKERDLTREQIGDQIKELVELAIRFVGAIKAFEVLSSWRESTADGRVATRRIEANPKLSDLA